MPNFLHTDIELFHNVCYIVCGVVVERGRVLMVQEAKPSCRGKWYLPAGRMERNESIVVGEEASWQSSSSWLCVHEKWLEGLPPAVLYGVYGDGRTFTCLSVCRRL